MVVMVMADHHDIDNGDIFNLAWRRREALQIFQVDGRAAVFEDGVEEHAQTRGVFDEEAGVAEPGGAEVGGLACGVECGCVDGDGWGSSVWDVLLA